MSQLNWRQTQIQIHKWYKQIQPTKMQTHKQIPVHKWYKCISRTNEATPYPESNNSEGMLMQEGKLMLFSSNTECGRQSMTSTLHTFSSFSISYRSCADTKATSPLFATFGLVSGSVKGVPSKGQKWKVNLR